MLVSTHSPAMEHTAECIVFAYRASVLRIPLVHPTPTPCADRWVLPGGTVGPDATLEQTAQGIVDDLGIHDLRAPPCQVATYSNPRRHPLGRVVSTGFYALAGSTPPGPQLAGTARWHALDTLPDLGFDHLQLVTDARLLLAAHLRTRPLAFELLPEHFTLADIHRLYAAILGERPDRHDFRRRIAACDFVVELGGTKRPRRDGQKLFRLDRERLQRHRWISGKV